MTDDPEHHRLSTNDLNEAVCACGWHARSESPGAAGLAFGIHVNEMTNPARFALTDAPRDYGMRVQPRGAHAPVKRWVMQEGLCAAECTCGWKSPMMAIPRARAALQAHIDKATPEHRSDGNWWSVGLVQSRCTCGWHSSAQRRVEDAEAILKVHLEKPRNAAGVIDNPDLPKLLLALANGIDAQKNQTHIILRAAAEELEAWRALEGARRIGGQVVG